ncbi:MAG: PAS domain-containing protein [bacterium]
MAIVLFNFLFSHQNYQLLTGAYARMQTYTGNILQNMADAVVAVERQGQIMVFNRAAEKLFGLPAGNSGDRQALPGAFARRNVAT